jgi:putative RecB family exonuclease
MVDSGVPAAVAELSHSRLEAFEKCPRAFWHAYVARTPPDGYDRAEAHTGTIVHEVLEEALRQTLDKRIPDPVWILQRFDELWAERTTDRVLIVKAGMTLDDYRRRGREWLKGYVDQAWPFVQNGVPLHVEEEVRFPVTLDDGTEVHFRGNLDRVDRLDDGRLRLIDYKTGSRVPAFEQPRDAFQLALYWRGLLHRYPDTPGGVLVWHYLQHQHAKRIDPEPALIAAAEAWVAKTASTIKKKLTEPGDVLARFPTRPSPLCRWCEFGYACDDNPNQDAAPRPPAAPDAPA